MACSHCGTRASAINLALFLDNLNNYTNKNMYIKIRKTKPNWGLKLGNVYLHKDIDKDILSMGLQMRYFRETDEKEYLKYNPPVVKPEISSKVEEYVKIETDIEQLEDKQKENEDTEPVGEKYTVRKKSKRGRPKKRDSGNEQIFTSDT